MKVKLIIAVIALASSFNTLATSIDVRHEISDTSQHDHKDRVLISHRFANGFGLSLEAKWKQDSSKDERGKAFHEQISNGTDIVASYLYKLNDTVSIQPGFSMESNSSTNGYRPYLRGQYTINEYFYVASRYRYEYKRTASKGSDGDEKINRGDLWLGYKINAQWQMEYNYVYKKSDKVLFDNKKHDYEHDVKLSYRWDKNWKPYIQVGNVKQDSTSDHRQTRFRAGVAYSW